MKSKIQTAETILSSARDKRFDIGSFWHSFDIWILTFELSFIRGMVTDNYFHSLLCKGL